MEVGVKVAKEVQIQVMDQMVQDLEVVRQD